MRVRHLGLAGLGLVLGASLVRSSMPLAIASNASVRSVNFSLAATAADAEGGPSQPVAATGVWVVDASPSDATAFTFAGRSPSRVDGSADGLGIRELSVQIGADDPRQVVTNAVTVADLLDALGVRLGPRDRVRPGTGALVEGAAAVTVVRIRQRVETETVETAFPTLIQYSKELAVGETSVTQAGRPGTEVRTYRVTYRNGVEVARVLLAATVTGSPIPQIELRGTAAVPVQSAGTSHVQSGQASWYACSGMYAAHLSIPKGTVVTVTNLDNGKRVTVVINDRGPYGVPGRIIDLCSTAFAAIAPLGQGVANVSISW